MTHRLQNFFMAIILAALSFFWAQSAVFEKGQLFENPMSGGYQSFEQSALANIANNPLNALEKIVGEPEAAPECCNAPKGGVDAPNLTERGTLTNTRPGDQVVLQNTQRTLVQDSSGRYWLEGPTGNRITPSGSYDFVTMPDGSVRVARPNTNPEYSTHLGLSNGGEVNYAGSIRFGNNTGPDRGNITGWSNNSGHYTPPAEMSSNAGLPLDNFSAH